MKKLYAYLFFFLPAAASAQGVIDNPVAHIKTSSGKSVTTITDVIDVALNVLIQIAIPVVAIMIIMAGFNFATAKGDPKKIAKARAMITYIVIGLTIILASKGIQLALQSTIESLK